MLLYILNYDKIYCILINYNQKNNRIKQLIEQVKGEQ